MKTGKVTQNKFFSLLGETLRLLYEAENTNEEFLKNCLITSSILTATYSLEAAANCVLEALENPVNERSYSTLEKFDLVLSHNTDKKINKGCKEYHGIKKLIDLRNESVHPKITTKKFQYGSEKSDGEFSWYHKEMVKNPSKKSSIQNIHNEQGHWSVTDAKLAVKAVVDFLNIYVCDWWELDQEIRDFIFLPQTDISHNGDTRMYDIDTLRMLKKYEGTMQLRIINLPELPQNYA